MALPRYQDDPTVAALNQLKAKIREIEVCAVIVFCTGDTIKQGDQMLVTQKILGSAVYLPSCIKS